MLELVALHLAGAGAECCVFDAAGLLRDVDAHAADRAAQVAVLRRDVIELVKNEVVVLLVRVLRVVRHRLKLLRRPAVDVVCGDGHAAVCRARHLPVIRRVGVFRRRLLYAVKVEREAMRREAVFVFERVRVCCSIAGAKYFARDVSRRLAERNLRGKLRILHDRMLEDEMRAIDVVDEVVRLADADAGALREYGYAVRAMLNRDAVDLCRAAADRRR